ncbi:hypothetical protein CACET_c04850 [Clostridium aceticum]|uniref:Uncharacterized protein n=1 Tax=Clostridium aceticum TaxID=84022 RepID=A0A0G3W830_9CLOT|nr:hypothetical protein CACET_c04850 [Clostridium aceticum]
MSGNSNVSPEEKLLAVTIHLNNSKINLMKQE